MRTPEVGELKERIDILNVTAPYGVDGVGTVTSKAARGVRAKVSPIGGSQVADTQQTQAFAQGYDIWIRYRSGVTPFQQIYWSGLTLTQTAPPEEFSGRWIVFHAQTIITRHI